MVKAVKGNISSSGARIEWLITGPGVLIQCDESIMAIILKIDSESNHAFIMETLDDETCLVQAKKLIELQARLKDVTCHLAFEVTAG